jgi:hypothetical protein
MNRTSNGTPGTDANKITKAEAMLLTFFIRLATTNSLSLRILI